MDLARRLPLRRRTSRNAPTRATGARQLTDPDWHFPHFDENMGRAVGEDYAAADVLLLGRVTYDSFAGAWPDRETAGGEDASYAAQLGDTPYNLKVLATEVFPTGVIRVTYAPTAARRSGVRGRQGPGTRLHQRPLAPRDAQPHFTPVAWTGQ